MCCTVSCTIASTPNSTSSGHNVADQLEKFEGMLRRGSLTQDEFDAQKQRLLEQL